MRALLNRAPAAELACMLRYKRHHFTAPGHASLHIAAELAADGRRGEGHADRLAPRIVQLGGLPESSPDTLTLPDHTAYDASSRCLPSIKANRRTPAAEAKDGKR